MTRDTPAARPPDGASSAMAEPAGPADPHPVAPGAVAPYSVAPGAVAPYSVAPGAVNPYPVAPGPGRWRPRLGWLTLVTAGWAVLLLLVAAVSVRRDEPTVREQRSLIQAAPVVDRAIEDLVAAAGPDVVVALVERQVAEGCRITPLRSGAELESVLALRTTATGGPALLDRVASNLPADYRAGTRRGTGQSTPRLRADAGEFVAVSGALTEPGLVEIAVRTGCRPASGDALAELLPGLPIDDEPGRVLAALGATPAAPPERISAACAGGDAIHTVRASGTGAGPVPPAQAAAAPAGAVVVSELPELYAYRHGPLSIVVEELGGEVRVTATTTC